MLIDEKSGSSVSVKTKDNIKEVCEATSVNECNKLLREGWGLLTTVPGYFYKEQQRGMTYGVVYVMSRTVK